MVALAVKTCERLQTMLTNTVSVNDRADSNGAGGQPLNRGAWPVLRVILQWVGKAKSEIAKRVYGSSPIENEDTNYERKTSGKQVLRHDIISEDLGPSKPRSTQAGADRAGSGASTPPSSGRPDMGAPPDPEQVRQRLSRQLEQYLEVEGRGSPGDKTRREQLRDLDRKIASRGRAKLSPEEEERFYSGTSSQPPK